LASTIFYDKDWMQIVFTVAFMTFYKTKYYQTIGFQN